MNLWILLLFISLMDLDVVSTKGAYFITERILFYHLNLITVIKSKNVLFI